jgi:NAD-dependent SIR2 family protein deacetylase
VVYPAVAVVTHAKRHGARVLEINPEKISSFVDCSLRGQAEEVFPQLLS